MMDNGYDTARYVYAGLLRLHQVRHLIQPELCKLRDYIALMERLSPETVQDSYEARSAEVQDA